MKFSSETIKILKNFATINPSLVFEKGDVQYSISPSKTVVAKAKITEEMPTEFGIYDLSKFLSVFSMFKDPEIKIDNRYAIFKEDKSKIQYNFAAAELFLRAPSKTPAGDTLASFTLSAQNIEALNKAAAVLSSDHLQFSGEDGSLYVKTFVNKDSSSDQYVVELGECDQDFKATIKWENFKLIQADYKVNVAKTYIQFVTENPDITYWVAVEI